MTISAIIPAYRPHNIKECVLAIADSSYKPYEIILVDDNSQADYFKDIRQYCKIIKLDKHSGPARARNAGARASNSELLCFIDSDVLVFEDTLELIASIFRKDPEISAVQTACIDRCSFGNFASQYQNLYFHFNTIRVKEKYLATIIGHCFAVRKKDFDLVGGFDEGIRGASVEDGNFGLNLYKLNKKIYLDKGIKVQHKSCLSPLAVISKMFMKSSDKIYTLLKGGDIFKVNLDKTEHSKLKITAILMSLFFASSLIGAIFSPRLLIPSLFILMVYVCCSWKFVYFCFRKNGPIFAIRVALFHYLNCLFASFGIVYGLLRFFKYRFIK
ncbi:MAG: glycosyltransferase [Candidatus Omnitrophica bacterium]|jgi:GT2 family glycosyltransferase|nr:glycosyltransferase [Candidatus Omnitrophota bacterium]